VAVTVVVIIFVLLLVAIVGRSLGNQNPSRPQDELLRNSSLAMVDAMTGTQFEQYVANLLNLRGYRKVSVVGGAGDGGVDILATDSTGTKIACQCKRQTAAVSVQVIRQLLGSVSHEHRGRIPYIVTTATLTKAAAELALGARVNVIDRVLLASWMTEARTQLASSKAGSPNRVDNLTSPKTLPVERAGSGAVGVTRSELYAPSRKPSVIQSYERVSAKPVISWDGIFVVGRDIEPGKYHTAGPVRDGGYWALLSSMDPDDVIDNGVVTRPVSITVGPGVKAIKVRGCQPWHLIADSGRQDFR
jgi:restriction system protein